MTPDTPQIVSREEWLTARKALLAQEKEETLRRDALRAERRALPMVEVTEDYVFHGEDGPRRLLDLFEGRRQLIVHHVMFDPAWEDGCSSCTFSVDQISAHTPEHLADAQTSYVLVSRAPLPKLLDYKARRGWTLPWYSSHGSRFNYDFQATVDPDVAPVRLNFRDLDELEAIGKATDLTGEYPGYSVFLRDGDGRVFHQYSTYARGVELVNPSTQFLDLTPLGRDGA